MKPSRKNTRGDSVIVHYDYRTVTYTSFADFADSLSMSRNRVKNIVGEKREFTASEYEFLIQESFRPARRGCLPGESHWKNKKKGKAI